MKRLTALLLLLLLLTAAAFAGEDTVFEMAADFPPAGEFLSEGEFLLEDAENGLWRYCSSTLWVEIHRMQTTKPKLIWYEAEVYTNGDTWHMIPNDPAKRFTSQNWPYKIARKNGTVLAVNSDYAQLRISQKKRVGIIVRDGKIISERTLAKNKGTFPNLDTLALLPDGDWKVFWSDELKAQEYLDMGAYDVLAFGPWLIRDGELNKAAIKKYATTKQPRTAVGMVEKGHYWAIMAEGRHSGSNGANLTFLAETLQGKGCTVAFNLDGGQTSTIVFMGKQLCKIGGSAGKNASARKTAEILGIGTSALAEGE